MNHQNLINITPRPKSTIKSDGFKIKFKSKVLRSYHYLINLKDSLKSRNTLNVYYFNKNRSLVELITLIVRQIDTTVLLNHNLIVILRLIATGRLYIW